jgi:transcriptional regulator with XRE-family HTH domain
VIKLRIREIREKVGMSQNRLARDSGVSQGKISEYESGKSLPRIDSAKKIADVLNVDISELIEEAV